MATKDTVTVRGETDDQAQANRHATWIVSRGDCVVKIHRMLVEPMVWYIEGIGRWSPILEVRATDFAVVHARAVAMLEGGR